MIQLQQRKLLLLGFAIADACFPMGFAIPAATPKQSLGEREGSG